MDPEYTTYGQVAIEAARLARSIPDPRKAWRTAASRVCTTDSSRDKSCPMMTFIGMAEAGLISGFSSRDPTKPNLNGNYGIRAASILKAHPSTPVTELWAKTMEDVDPAKKHNQQMNVVLALQAAGLLS